MEKGNRKYVIGIDTGGTFTDAVAVTEQGEVFVEKAPTTPHDFSIGVMDSLEELSKRVGMEREEVLSQCQVIKHGTTVATNALINRSGARVGLITTRGFEDTTLIMRAIGRVAGLDEEGIKHQATAVKPEPIVPRELVRGVTERIDFQGRVVIPINAEEAREAIRSLVEDCQVEAIAINFLFGFINPVHERKIKELVLEMYGGMDIYCSFANELAPVVREYARSNTVIIDSFLGRTCGGYVDSLAAKLEAAGHRGLLLLMQANGGIVHKEEYSPVGMLSSGPAGGIIGSKYMADILGHRNIIATDMGGTSFDVGLIVDGLWRYAREPVVERFHISWPMIEIESIGAGGGTIATVDPVTRRLLVGPRSAGADPGPVCYDMGGTEPTVTDADLVLGLLNPDYFLGGRMRLNKSKAEMAIREKIASPLNMDVVEAAAGIYSIVNAHMADLIRKRVVKVGYTPDEFTIYAFGGAGAVHCAAYAAEAEVDTVCVFPTSAVFSAFGIAGADIMHTYTSSYRYVMPVEPGVLNSRLAEIEHNLLDAMGREGIGQENVEFRRIFYMRYRRQLNELDIQVPVRTYDEKDIDEIMALFDKRYEEVYGEGTAYREAGVELISITVDAIGKVVKPVLLKHRVGRKSPREALKGHREVFFTDGIGDFVTTRIYDYERLTPGNVLEGPAIVETPITTVVIPPGKTGRMDSYRNIMIDIKG